MFYKDKGIDVHVYTMYLYLNIVQTYKHSIFSKPAPVECLLRGTVGHGFNPGQRHTKVVKNGTSCSSLGAQTYRVELGLVHPRWGVDGLVGRWCWEVSSAGASYYFGIW